MPLTLFGRHNPRKLSRTLHPDRHAPIGVPYVEGMITDEERDALACFAKHIWEHGGRRDAQIVDGGCYTGASTISLAYGLHHSNLAERERQGRIWSYDLFRATPQMSEHYLKGSGINPGDSFQPIFEKNIAPYRNYVTLHAGDIRRAPVPSQSIAILFLDVLWSWDCTQIVGTRFYPKLQPGRSLLIHQDFVYPFYPWVILSMGQLDRFFGFAYNVQYSSVVFDVLRAVRESDIDDPRNIALSRALKIYDGFIDRLEGWGCGAVALGKAFYLASLYRIDEARRLVDETESRFQNEQWVMQYLRPVRGYCDRVASLGKPIPLDEVVGI